MEVNYSVSCTEAVLVFINLLIIPYVKFIIHRILNWGRVIGTAHAQPILYGKQNKLTEVQSIEVNLTSPSFSSINSIPN